MKICKRLLKAADESRSGLSSESGVYCKRSGPPHLAGGQTLSRRLPTVGLIEATTATVKAAMLSAVLITAVVAAQQRPSVYREAAERIQRGDPQGAVALLEPHLKSNPSDLRAQTLLGMALSAAGRLSEANECFRGVLRVDSQFVPALQGLALNEIALGRTQEARRYLEQLLKITPTNPVAHLAMGDLAYAGKDFRAVVAYYDRSGGLFRTDPRRLLNYAQALVESNRPESAKAALADLPAEAEATMQFEAGLLLARLGDYQSAAARFEKARSHYPDRYEVEYNLALAYHKGNQPTEAVRILEHLAASGHSKAELYNLLGHAYRAVGRTQEAYEALRKAATLEPDDEANYLDLIALCLDQNNPDLAAEIADIGLQRRPESGRLWIQKGVVYAWKGLMQPARDAFARAAQLSKEMGLAHVALALALLQMNENAAAIELLRRRAQQDDYLAQWFLAEALYRSGAPPGSAEEQEAVEALEKSVRSKPDLGPSRALLGKLLFRRGDLEGAAAQLERALQIAPDDVSALYQLAQVYAKKGDVARSRELFARVSKIKANEREQFTSQGLQQILRQGTR
jgi:tetratricopeptide (TPR) repeat protein